MHNMVKNLVIPIENLVRELDAKLVLAILASRRNFTSFIGSRLEIDFRIASFPRSIYLSKSMTARSLKMFRIMTMLGHHITAWDEEALIHPPDRVYFSRRMSPESIKYVSELFAWGEENAELWRRYPHLPEEIKIHLTGNPRGDMLRPELRGVFSEEAKELQKEHGRFLLINTNFSFVNPFFPEQGLLRMDRLDTHGKPSYGRAAVGMDREFVERLYRHKSDVFASFKKMIPVLNKSFPELTIIVRPHPVENPEVYHLIANQSPGIKVINEGNVIPWLLAAVAVIHNGCTTGVEAYMLEVPAVSYQAAGDRDLDRSFYHLPNYLSHQCFSLDELLETLTDIESQRFGAASGQARKRLMAHYLASQDGPLACELILDRLEETAKKLDSVPLPSFSTRCTGAYLALKRRVKKHIKALKPGSKYRPSFQRYRFPEISLESLQNRVKALNKSLGVFPEPEIRRISRFVFRIGPGRNRH